jgi:hypothetical protein
VAPGNQYTIGLLVAQSLEEWFQEINIQLGFRSQLVGTFSRAIDPSRGTASGKSIYNWAFRSQLVGISSRGTAPAKPIYNRAFRSQLVGTFSRAIDPSLGGWLRETNIQLGFLSQLVGTFSRTIAPSLGGWRRETNIQLVF